MDDRVDCYSGTEYADRPGIVELPMGADADAARSALDYVRALSV